MRSLLLAPFIALALSTSAQTVSWLQSNPVDFSLNPGMPAHVVASAPGRLVAMRMVDVNLIYGQTVYGSVGLDALDPATGSLLLSCLLLDSVSVQAAAVHSDGIAYFTGKFMGDVLEFCDGSQLPGIGGGPFTENIFLLAWDLTTLAPLWMRNLSATYSEGYEVPSIAMDHNGELWYIMQDFFDGRVVRVDADGNDAESRAITGIRRFGTISFDPWGGLYVSGSCENGTLSFGGQDFAVESDEGYNMFVLRYKPDGTAGFAEFAEDVTFTNPTVVATTDGHAYLAGDLFLQGTTWGGITFNGPNWVYDVFLTKLDSTGQFLWGRDSAPASGAIIGDMYRAMGPCIAVDGSDHPYLMGTLRGQVDWGNGVVSDGLTLGTQTITIVSFSPDGTPQWAVTSMPSGFCQSQTLTAMAEDDALHFIGHITSQLTFGPHTTNVGGMQAAMVGRIGELSTGVEMERDAPGLLAWPNPARTACTIHSMRSQSAQLVDGAGQLVRSMRLSAGANTIGFQGITAGVYLLRAEDGRVTKLAIE